MKRYATKVEDGTFYVEDDDGWLEVGDLDAIVELIGGPEFSLEYDDYGRAVDWTDTDDRGVMTFDVEETLREMSYQEEFVADLAARDADALVDGHPERMAFFAERMVEIWESKGDREED